MPRSTPAKKATPKPAPADPLADLRESDEAEGRYPAPDGQEQVQDGPEAPGEGDPLTALILERLEAAMAIPLGLDGVITDEARQMATGLAVETAEQIAQVPVQATNPEDAVERWHADTVAVGFLHKGGRCGCAYLARVVLGA